MSSEHDKAILNSIFNPFLPLGDIAYDEELPDNIRDEEIACAETTRAKALELEGVEATESDDLDKAIGCFTLAIQVSPLRPSAYNNRAQCLRLKGDLVAALADLDKAIELSQGHGRSGCQALCQRGIINRKEGRDDAARLDYQTAAKLGSQFAKTQLIELNPYAALCNQMLHDVMGKLK